MQQSSFHAMKLELYDKVAQSDDTENYRVSVTLLIFCTHRETCKAFNMITMLE